MRPLGLFLTLLGIASWASGTAIAAPPPIRHVFVIVLENKDGAKTFAADSPAPYLAHALPRQGEYVPNFYGIGHVSLDNYVAMISGQAPNPQTQSDCQFYTSFMPGVIGADDQAVGQGCLYPPTVATIGNQLTSRRLTWRGYMEDMGADPARDNGTRCAHPALGSRDPTQIASVRDPYATRHNPFVYFRSITDDTAYCRDHDVPLSALAGDLRPPPPLRASRSSPPTCAMTRTTPPAPTAHPEGFPRRTPSSRSGSRGSPRRRPSATGSSS